MKQITLIISAAFLIITLGSSFNAQVLTPTPRDGFYDKIHYPNRRVVSYAYMREADVMFQRRIWRMIDLREKINQTLYYPEKPSNLRKNLITIIMDAVLTEQSLKAYDPLGGDDFKVELTTAEVANIGVRKDSMQMTRPYPPYETFDTAIVTPFDPSNVKKYYIKEDWTFEKQRSVFEPRILGICPLMAVIDPQTGAFRDYKQMFWLYFPELRKVLINEEVYNPYNFGQRLTYDDVFIKRIFNGLIYKVDNTFDRKIEDYLKGIDALLEAEEIKNTLMDYEHNLWEQ